jgi:hypothetical protein
LHQPIGDFIVIGIRLFGAACVLTFDC